MLQGPVPTDEDLMLAFRGGRTEAFDSLFERYEQRLWGGTSAGGSGTKGAPRSWRRKRSWPCCGAPTATKCAPRFARTCTRSRSTSCPQRGARARKVAAVPLRPSDPVRPSIDDNLWMRQAIERLEPMDREVVMLREFEDLSYVEIAAVLVIPVNTVRSRLFRAREALRKALRPDVVDLRSAT